MIVFIRIILFSIHMYVSDIFVRCFQLKVCTFLFKKLTVNYFFFFAVCFVNS